MERFKDIYRIPSTRAEWKDYSGFGLYYITLCTKGRECLFGKIENDAVILTEIGCIVDTEWQKSFNIRKELSCDTYIIMPDHLHAIVFIDSTERHENTSIETHSRASLHVAKTGIAYRPPKSLSSFIAGFKSSATKQINEYRKKYEAVWQARFYDRIIRTEEEYKQIKFYIESNPSHKNNNK